MKVSVCLGLSVLIHIFLKDEMKLSESSIRKTSCSLILCILSLLSFPLLLNQPILDLKTFLSLLLSVQSNWCNPPPLLFTSSPHYIQCLLPMGSSEVLIHPDHSFSVTLHSLVEFNHQQLFIFFNLLSSWAPLTKMIWLLFKSLLIELKETAT